MGVVLQPLIATGEYCKLLHWGAEVSSAGHSLILRKLARKVDLVLSDKCHMADAN